MPSPLGISGNFGPLAKRWANRAAAGCSRSAVAGKLQRLGLHRRHRPPTLKPVIVALPKRIYPPAVVVPHALPRNAEPHHCSKQELRAMLAEAAANTARL